MKFLHIILKNHKSRIFHFITTFLMCLMCVIAAQGQEVVPSSGGDGAGAVGAVTPCGAGSQFSFATANWASAAFIFITYDGAYIESDAGRTLTGCKITDDVKWTGSASAYAIESTLGATNGNDIYVVVSDSEITFSFTQPICGPKITSISETTLELTNCSGDAAFPTKTFTITGTSLNDPGIEITSDNSNVTFNGDAVLAISKTDGEAGFLVEVAYSGTTPVAPITITCTAVDAVVPDVKTIPLIIETIAAGAIKSNKPTLALTYLTVSTPDVQTATIEGLCLTDPITITAPAGFQVSSDGVNFAASATLPVAGGTLYVRIDPALTAPANPSGDITLESGTASTTIALTGTVVDKTPETFYARKSGDWSKPDTWSLVKCPGYEGDASATPATTTPTVVDIVIICDNAIVTVDVNAACASLTVNGANASAGITIGANNSLSVTGDFAMSTGNQSPVLTLGNGSMLTIGGDFTAQGQNNAFNISLASGSVLTAENIDVTNLNTVGTLTVASGATLTARNNLSLLSSGQGTIAGAGKIQVGGAFSFGNTANVANQQWSATGITLEKTGCNANISLSKAITVNTFIQAEAPCVTSYNVTGAGSLTVSAIYDQNCN
ncbi:MAG: hypothetical protein LBR55_03900, partial [Bacteroidales bacterium]|nr:hypothetical protein [Bacteroidales bacterium]